MVSYIGSLLFNRENAVLIGDVENMDNLIEIETNDKVFFSFNQRIYFSLDEEYEERFLEGKN